MHLKLGYRPWSGSHQVPAEKAGILVLEEIVIEDMIIPPEWAKIDLDVFMTITISRPEVVAIDRYLDDTTRWQILHARFSEPDLHVEGTDENTIILPISSVELVELATRTPTLG